jgi:hypothetical protein
VTGAAVVVDAERAEVRGSPEAVRALLDGADEPGPPLLAAGLRAARSPLARFRVTGLQEPLEAMADAHAAVLVLPLAGGETALRACTPSGLLGLLVRAVGLCPRPRAAGGPIVVGGDRMARIVNERTAAGAGLDEADEERLQAHLDALAGHWRIEAYGQDGGWYLEVLDSELGLWTVEDAPDNRLVLGPTDATAVLDEIAAIPGHVGLGPPA